MGLIASEVRKLTSVRTVLIVTLLGLLLVGAPAAFTIFMELGLGGPFTGADAQLASLIDQIGGNSIIVLVVGLLAMTTEFRHGTIGRTLQITPGRLRVLVAKLLVGGLYGLVFFVLGLVVVAGVVALASALLGAPGFALGGEVATAMWQGAAGLVLTAFLGVAVGALLRSQVVAIVVSLLWVMVAETLFVQFVPSFGRWLPFQALNSVFISEGMMAGMPEGSPFLAPELGLSVFLAYVVVAGGTAVLLMRVRDV